MKYLVLIACLGMTCSCLAWTLDTSKPNTTRCPRQVEVKQGDDGDITLNSVLSYDGAPNDVRWAIFKNINQGKSCSKSNTPFTRVFCVQSSLDNSGYHYAYCSREGFFFVFPCSPFSQDENHEGATVDLNIQSNELSFQTTDHTNIGLQCYYNP